MVCELCHMSMLWRNVYEKDAPSSCRLESGLGYKTRLRNVFFVKKTISSFVYIYSNLFCSLLKYLQNNVVMNVIKYYALMYKKKRKTCLFSAKKL